MPIEGVIKTLYSNPEKTTPVFPTTKVKAISDEDGKRLDKILEDKYATKNFVKTEITNAQIGGGNGDANLDGYATEDYVDDAIKKIDFPVDSVNGQTGAIQLTASEVGAKPANWMPSASDVGAAPAGFGLGTLSTFISDCNTALLSGFYKWDVGCANSPFDYATMIVFGRYSDACNQIAICNAGIDRGKVVSRTIDGSGATPWVRLDSAASAPAGYGLGSQEAKLISGEALSNHRASGWYRYSDTVTDSPLGGYGGNMLVIASDLHIIQIAYISAYNDDPHHGCVAKRIITPGVNVDEWEWVNPPMIPGVEYRTTERWNGKVVYKKLVNLGTLPNATIKYVQTEIDGTKYRIVDSSLRLYTSSGYARTNTQDNFDFNFGFETGTIDYSVCVVTTLNYSDMSGEVLISYVEK